MTRESPSRTPAGRSPPRCSRRPRRPRPSASSRSSGTRSRTSSRSASSPSARPTCAATARTCRSACRAASPTSAAPGAEHRAHRQAEARPHRRAEQPRRSQPEDAAQDRQGARDQPLSRATPPTARSSTRWSGTSARSATRSASPSGAEAVLRDMSRTFSSLRKRCSGAKRGGTRVTIATPGGTTSSPALRLFTNNSAAAEIVRRLGLRNAWTASAERYGFSTVGVEALRKVQSGWLAFVYPGELAGPDQALHGPELLQAPDVRQEASACATCAGTRGCSAGRCPRRSSRSA